MEGRIFWSIPSDVQTTFYLAALVSAVVFFIGVWSRMRIWNLGREDDELRTGTLGLFKLSIVNFFSPDCIFARRVFAVSKLRGIMLIFIVWGFTAFFLLTFFDALGHYLGFKRPYLAMSFLWDAAGAALFIGAATALIRRYISLDVKKVTSLEDLALLWLLLLVVLLGFLTEALRMVAYASGTEWSPVGYAVSVAIGDLYSSSLYKAAWLSHAIAAFVFIAYIPYSKMSHVFAAQITTSLASERYGGAVNELYVPP